MTDSTSMMQEQGQEMDRLFSVEAERAVLGCALQDAARILKLCADGKVGRDSFYIDNHRRLFMVMRALDAAQMPVDFITVTERLREDGLLDRIGGEEELGQLISGTPTTAHAEYYIQRLRQLHQRRQMLDSVQQAQQTLLSGDPIDPIASDLMRIAERVKSQKSGGPLVTTFPPLNYDGLMALEINPADHHIVGKGFIRRGAWTLLTGGTGLGKSVLVEQLASCVACGKSFMGLSVASCFKVLLLTAENDEETLKRDLMAIADHEGLSNEALTQNLQIHHAFALDGKELFEAMDAEIERGGFDLVILDNFQAFSDGDINDSKAWKQFITPMIRILKQHNMAMLLVDHTGKPQDRKNWGTHDSVYIAAGTSGKANGARCSVELYSPTDDDERYKLHFGKNWERNGLASEAGIRIRDVYLDRATNSESPYWAPSADQTEHRPMLPDEQTVLDYLEEHPMATIRGIADGTFLSKSKVARIMALHPELTKYGKGRE